MGTTAHVVVSGDEDRLAGLLDAAFDRIEQAEARWSRFRPGSELCRLNAASGRLTLVSPATYDLLALAVTAWRATDGAFDPTVHDALVRLGYDRDFGAIGTVALRPTLAAPGCGDIELLAGCHGVRLPAGVHLDLGGIAKGHTADLVVEHLLAAGAAGACVNIGGDVRVGGAAPGDQPWVVALDPCVDGVTVPRLALQAGAVCTSSTRRRRWRRGTGEAHHLIDPRSGRSVGEGLATVTVIARAAAQAEVLTKAVLVRGVHEGRELLESLGAAAVLVTGDGVVLEAGNVREFHA